MKAIWNNQVIAESKKTIVVENNHYFPVASLRQEYFTPSQTTTWCPWKGTANYYCINVDGKRNDDAAWYYADPKKAARNIKGHVAFWKGVVVSE